MYEYLKTKRLRNLVVVSPDVGGLKMAYAYSQVLEGSLAIVAKRRKSASEVGVHGRHRRDSRQGRLAGG